MLKRHPENGYSTRLIVIKWCTFRSLATKKSDNKAAHLSAPPVANCSETIQIESLFFGKEFKILTILATNISIK